MNSTKIIIVVVAAVFVVVLAVSIPLTFANADVGAPEIDEDIFGDNNDYYCEVTSYDTVDRFNEAMVANMGFFDSRTDITAEEKLGEFIAGVSKKVWVAETRMGDTVVSSRLMSEEDIQSLERRGNASARGEDYYTLTLFLKVTDGDGLYRITTKAAWKNFVEYDGKQTFDDFSEDVLAVNWGGEGYLARQDFNFVGKHANGADVVERRFVSDGYGAMAWAFVAKTWHYGAMMKYAGANVALKSYAEQPVGKQTNVQLTYVHTYLNDDFRVAVGEIGKDIAANVTTSGIANHWQLQLDVAGLIY